MLLCDVGRQPRHGAYVDSLVGHRLLADEHHLMKFKQKAARTHKTSTMFMCNGIWPLLTGREATSTYHILEVNRLYLIMENIIKICHSDPMYEFYDPCAPRCLLPPFVVPYAHHALGGVQHSIKQLLLPYKPQHLK